MARLALVALLAVSCAPASELPGGQPSSASNPPGKASTRNPARAVPYPRAVLSRPARRADRDMQRAPLRVVTIAQQLNWPALAHCESTGNPRAVDPSGRYFGLYQFDLSTWASVGGVGNPVAASPTEQTYRAELLYGRAGDAPWPVCGWRLAS